MFLLKSFLQKGVLVLMQWQKHLDLYGVQVMIFFCIQDKSDNHLLFTFELRSDLEKALMGEPWSFDRHLVVLQRYDGILPMEKIDFLKLSF